MFRHLVNVGLLFAFLTLAASGILSFVRPFSLITTRLHVVAGLFTLVFVIAHLAVRIRYFRSLIGLRSRRPLPVLLLVMSSLAWIAIVVAALQNWQPIRALIAQSYESRLRHEIVRVHPLSTWQRIGTTSRSVRQGSSGPATLLEVRAEWKTELRGDAGLAIWVESTAGSLIETLFLSQDLAFQPRPVWEGRAQGRHHILPVWRHRYTLVSGVDPEGNIDVLTGATPQHAFSVDQILQTTAEEFVVHLEINPPDDDLPAFIYAAYLQADSPNPYALLELIGHGGGEAHHDGQIRYDLSEPMLAAAPLKLGIVRAERASISEPAEKSTKTYIKHD